MGTFTISQSQPGQEVWLYPSGDGCVTDLNTSSGATDHYVLVDELKDAYDDDSTYVYSDATSVVTDLYLTNESVVSSLAGTINYIQIYARAKSHLYPQHEDGIYKIIVLDDPTECTDGGIYKSNDKDLTTGYQTLSYVWNNNPSTATLWTWTDIEDLQIGLQCSSPTLTDYLVTSTYRPNAAGDKTQLTAWSNEDLWLATNWECVDDVIPDGNKSCVLRSFPYDGGSLATDLYNIPNHTTEVGTIQKIVVFYRTNCQIDTDGYAGAAIKIGGNEYFESLHDVAYQWSTYSYEWTQNPATSSAWTWANIDDLQIGLRLQNLEGWIQCTQVYMVVYYYAALNPEIRTTQVYAKINYDGVSECTLNKPQEISIDHDRNIKMLNFWSGNRAVYDIGRNRKTMVLSGMQHGPSACTVMQCVEAIAKFGTEITTTGLGAVLDDTFRIISFGYKCISHAPLTYEWILELEYANLDEDNIEPEGI